MSINKNIFYIINITIYILLISFIFILKNKTHETEIKFQKTQKKLLTVQQQDTKQWLEKLDAVYIKKYNQLDEKIKKDLKQKVYKAYNNAKNIYNNEHNKKSSRYIKQRLKDSLKGKVFITDFKTNSILIGEQRLDKKNISNYLDADHRSIVLEELQKVRRHGEAFIDTKHAGNNLKETIFVKNLDMYNWFIGNNLFKKDKVIKLNLSIIKMLNVIPLNNSNFLTLYKKDKKQFFSKNITKTEKLKLSKTLKCYKNTKYQYCSMYINNFDNYVVYGFLSKN